MSKLQDYLKQIGAKRRKAFEKSVREINNIVGNDAVRIIVGNDAATVYYGTQTMDWSYHYDNPTDTGIISMAETFLKNVDDAGAWKERTKVKGKEVEVLQGARHWADGIKTGDQWKEAMLCLIERAQYLGAWPTGKTYEAKTGRILTKWGNIFHRRQKSYACTKDGWLALIDDISGVFPSRHGRRYARA